eukprot:CCRYP_008014-RA/>CCRYP_008014-RA protein AED:0.05 eAED:0.05 QI:116/1/1/1/1/1/3/724/333
MVKLSVIVTLLLHSGIVSAFTASPSHRSSLSARSTRALHATSLPNIDLDANSADDSSRRTLLSQALAATTLFTLPLSSNADDASATVVVAGATGQTGRRILERLASQPNVAVIAGVRNVEKAEKSLSESSTVVRGAMVQKVPSLDAAGVELRKLDVSDSTESLTAALSGANSLVIAVGFVPSNPLKMAAAAHEVDNVGTCKLIDAAKSAGVKKVVLVSSILTNGRNWGQEKSPGFVVTNAFGNVLDEKLVAENYLRKSGLDYTIVRPGGLKAKPPTGALKISGEDTLIAGEISRDLVADVCVASLTDKKASNKVLEIIEDEGTEPQVFNGLIM